MNQINIGDAIGYGWNTVRKNWAIVGYIFLALFGSQVISFIYGSIIKEGDLPLLTLVVSILTFVLSLILSVGLIRVLLNVFEGKKLEFENLYEDYKVVPYYFLASILSMVIILVGFILLIVPGVILAIRLSMWPYLMIDKKMGVIESLQKSWDMTRGNALSLFLLFIVEGFVVLLGILALFVGVFVAIPVTYLANIYVYKKLLKESK